MKRYLQLFILSFLSTLSAFADGVTLTVNAPSAVEEGDKFYIRFTVNSQNVSGFSAPDFKGFEVIYGPSTSSQSSYSIVNGHTTQSSSITYTYVVLGSVAGTYTLGSASIQADGKTVKSSPVQIKVLPIGQASGSQRQSNAQTNNRNSARPSRPVSGSDNGRVSSNDLFMTATASRTNVYEQEAILLTYKIYTTVNLTQLDGKLPTLDGFQIQEIPLPRNKQFELEQYNGRNYRSVIWSQYVLFPQKSGQLVIPAITYEGVVVQQNRNIDPFEAFFNGVSGMQELKKKIVTPKLVINVSPLPVKPANFSGAVGKFTLSSSINTKEIDANDALTLKVAVKGTGNMKLINTPEVKFPSNFETYDAKVNDNFSLTHSGLSGSKDFEFLAVPRSAGDYTIQPVEFVYFDTDSRSYKTLKSEPYTIKVNRGKGGGTVQSADYSGDQQSVKEIATDIRFIKQGDVTLSKGDNELFGSWQYVLYYIIPVLIAIGILVVERKRMMANRDIARTRGRKANKKAVKRMKVAKKLVDAQKPTEFYDETLKALWGYIADKLNMPLEKLNKDNIQAELSEHNVAQENIEQFIKVLNDCEFARYAPGDATQNMHNIYDSAISIISKMEENI